MLRNGIFVLFAVGMNLAVAVPFLAAAPAEGIILEGQTVPGIVLGVTRAEVKAAHGTLASCQGVEVPAVYAYCSSQVEGGGMVSVRYRDSDGAYASNCLMASAATSAGGSRSAAE